MGWAYRTRTRLLQDAELRVQIYSCVDGQGARSDGVRSARGGLAAETRVCREDWRTSGGRDGRCVARRRAPRRADDAADVVSTGTDGPAPLEEQG